ncbi:hypothetical protein GOBAR_DD19986 [Gossypium barbadense]|nr:hypothetical protein GOBAR_DD19986 [Gossypium barbadense]
MKELVKKIYRRCGRRISKLFYKFPVSTDPIKFTEIELVDDEDVKTMVALYCETRSNQNAPIQLFAINIDLNVAPETDVVGDDVYHSSDPSDHEVDSGSDPDVRSAEGYNWQIRAAFIQKSQIREIRKIVGASHMHFNTQCNCRRFQTLHYPCAHVVSSCTKVSLNVEQFIDEVYTLECTLRVWENEFPVLLDLSTWEVPPTTFELVPYKGLRRNLKGHPQSSRIHSEMDIREKSERKLCGICRSASHN